MVFIIRAIDYCSMLAILVAITGWSDQVKTMINFQFKNSIKWKFAFY